MAFSLGRCVSHIKLLHHFFFPLKLMQSLFKKNVLNNYEIGTMKRPSFVFCSHRIQTWQRAIHTLVFIAALPGLGGHKLYLVHPSQVPLCFFTLNINQQAVSRIWGGHLPPKLPALAKGEATSTPGPDCSGGASLGARTPVGLSFNTGNSANQNGNSGASSSRQSWEVGRRGCSPRFRHASSLLADKNLSYRY